MINKSIDFKIGHHKTYKQEAIRPQLAHLSESHGISGLTDAK